MYMNYHVELMVVIASYNYITAWNAYENKIPGDLAGQCKQILIPN